jgi:hypothetical protein
MIFHDRFAFHVKHLDRDVMPSPSGDRRRRRLNGAWPDPPSRPQNAVANCPGAAARARNRSDLSGARDHPHL